MGTAGGRTGGWTVIIAQSLAFLLPLGIYVRTLAREITFVDSGELAAAAYHLGIAHPPGYPLYTLIGHLFTKLPLGSVAFRMGLLSAVAGAAATALLFRAAWILVRQDLHRGRQGTATGIVAPLGVLAGALLFGFANTPWSQAVKVEVYTFQAVLLAALLAAAVTLLRHSAHTRVSDAGRKMLLVGLLFGLGLTHHLTAALSIIMLAGVALHRALAHEARRDGASAHKVHRDRRPAHEEPHDRSSWAEILRGWMWLGLGAALPLLLYLYLPLRSRMDPAINWNYPENWQRFWVHVSARQYHGLWGSQGFRWEELQRFLTDQLPGEATLGLPILALAGLILAYRRYPWILWTTFPMMLVYLAYNLGYPIPDIADYYVPVILLVAFWAAFGTGSVLVAAGRRGAPAAAGLLVVVMAIPTVTAVRHLPQRDLSDFQLASTYARDVVSGAREDGIVFSGSWEHFSGPMLYLQSVEGLRSDLLVLDMPSLSSPMLARSLERDLPALADACRRELESVAELASSAERGEQYNVEYARGLYRNFLRRLAQEAVNLRPVYALGAAFQHPMFEGLHRHPEGLLVRLTPDPDYRPSEMPRFELPVLLESEALGPAERQLLSSYLSMVDGRIRYLQHHGREEEAAQVRTYLDRIRR